MENCLNGQTNSFKSYFGKSPPQKMVYKLSVYVINRLLILPKMAMNPSFCGICLVATINHSKK